MLKYTLNIKKILPNKIFLHTFCNIIFNSQFKFLNQHFKNSTKIILTCLCAILLYGCASQQDNAANRRLQNLSARYNYIYNSNVLLAAYQETLSATYADNYDHLLSIYIAPPSINYLTGTTASSNTKALDEITLKAQAIVSEKNLSNYIDEAYLLLGKTNFYKGNYYSAAAYFDYVEKTYKKDMKVYLNALNWKARTYMQLQNTDEAKRLLDSVKVTLDSVKRGKGEPLATLAQMSIDQKEYKEAISYLTRAIKEEGRAQNRIRWSYILAQLHELDKDYDISLRNYIKVEKSNAPFEMYFNAKLSKIRINDLQNNQTFNRKQQLLKLLKDDKNFDYTDQIYFEVAEDYFADQDYKNAEASYKLSAQKSTINLNQKGLSYLKIADLNFKELNNDANAKLYYDSAINTLPKNYPNYEQIVKKAQNLSYLTDRYNIISTQDTLQSIAKLPLQEREILLASKFTPKAQAVEKETKKSSASGSTNFNLNTNSKSNSTFYFNNLGAISKGFTDFKKQWGSRTLEDNWRQSVKSSAQVNQQNIANANFNALANTNTASSSTGSNVVLDQIKAYTALLPVSPEQIAKSDQQIITAYVEIAGFYQQVLEDQEEAILAYETVLNRFPQNNHLEAIYYSLYLGYKATNADKSNYFKNLVLTKYPSSVYAKTILDPSFSTKQNDLAIEINKIYNQVFDLYEQKEYAHVITSVNETNQRFPGNNLQIQYDYLKAIAIGRTENLDSLLAAFQKITNTYPNDSLITPLIKDHLIYINAHLNTFKQRKIALIDSDLSEPQIAMQKSVTPVPVTLPAPVMEKPKENTPITLLPETTVKTTVPVITIPKPKPDSLSISAPVIDSFFSKAESNIYYYVIDVASTNISLSSSRFGIGQFNRGNYAGNGLKHQLIDIAENQLIYIGNFEQLSAVKIYAENISQQLSKIMKVPADTYRSFFISKENFDKIKTIETLNRYLEFFKNNY